MLKTLILVAAAAIAPTLVHADVCSATNNVLFFAWTVNLSGIESGCDATFEGLNFQGVMQQKEGGCAAITNFKCADPAGGGTTFTFDQAVFCAGGSIADAVGKTFGVDDFDCSGQGPA